MAYIMKCDCAPLAGKFFCRCCRKVIAAYLSAVILAFLSPSAVAQSGKGKPFHENHNAYYQVVSFCDGSPAQSKPDFANVHGHLLVGMKNLYISHLPLFMFDPEQHPHNYQLVTEISLSKPGSDPQAEYLRDRERHPEERIYTLAPEPFALTEIMAVDCKEGVLRTFTGDIFRGHFERGGRRILEKVTINVKGIVHAREFDPLAKKDDKLQYLLFGKGEELLMAHLITAPPDFDQVLSVNMPGHGQVITDEDLSRGVLVTFSERANSPSARLKEGEQTSAEIHTSVDGNPAALQVQGATEWYFEEGELNGFLPRPG